MTTKNKGAGNPPPITADDVRALLVKHLGVGAPVHAIAVDGIALGLNHPDVVCGDLSGQRTYTRIVRNARDAVRRLHKLLEENWRRGEWARTTELFDDEIKLIVKEKTEEHHRLLSTINDLLKQIPDLPPIKDRRSGWHDLAWYCAILIEHGYQKVNEDATIADGYGTAMLSPPTRRSMASPLVLAVQALLKQIGQGHDPDTIRKALGKYPH